MAGFGYTIKQGETARQVIDDLKLAGVPVDLTDAAVWFIMRNTSNPEQGYLEKEAVVQDAKKGTVVYRFQPGETDWPGVYNCEWSVVFSDGDRLPVPDNDMIQLEIIKSARKHANV